MHIISPFIFYLYVECIKKIPPIPKNKLMLTCRKYHNISLSYISAFLFFSSIIDAYNNNKFYSFHSLLCNPYKESIFTQIVSNTFLYSKYIEWGDTLYLHLSGKKITNLQYMHHMSTAFLTYIGIRKFINTGLFIAIFTNCGVHITMYWYFAYPKGVLQPYKKFITQLQLLQHIVVIYCIIYLMIYKNDTNCIQNPYSCEIGLSLYTMYFLFFLSFYLLKY